MSVAEHDIHSTPSREAVEQIVRWAVLHGSDPSDTDPRVVAAFEAASHGSPQQFTAALADLAAFHGPGSRSQWKDGEPLFMRAVVFGAQAEHVAETFQRGSRVIAHGKISQRNYETREGEKRTAFELIVDEFGGSARYATLRINKTARGQDQSEAGEDPWATPWGTSEPATAGAR